jgi:hypothetical protein
MPSSGSKKSSAEDRMLAGEAANVFRIASEMNSMEKKYKLPSCQQSQEGEDFPCYKFM